MENTKPNQQKSAIETHIEGERIEFRFANGSKFSIDLSELRYEMRAQAALHGLKQKIVDAAAISRDPETGRAASIEVKFAACKEVADRILSGAWNKNRENGEGASTGGLLVRALHKLYAGAKTIEQLQLFVAGLSKEQQAALRKSAKIAPIIESLRPAKPAPEADVEKLLAGLDASDEEGGE